MADNEEESPESDTEEEDTEEEDKKTGEKRITRRRITKNVSLSQRRQSLTFAFAIIGAMIVLRHHWFGVALKWSKAPTNQHSDSTPVSPFLPQFGQRDTNNAAQ